VTQRQLLKEALADIFFSAQTVLLGSDVDPAGSQTHSARVLQPQPALRREPGSRSSGLWTRRSPALAALLHGAEFCRFIPVYCPCHLAAAPALQFLRSYKWIRDLSGCQVNHHYHSRYHLAHTPHGSQLLAL